MSMVAHRDVLCGAVVPVVTKLIRRHDGPGSRMCQMTHVFVAASAALRLAPTRSARQSVLARHGGAGGPVGPHPLSLSPPPLRFGLLLLAPLDNRCSLGTAPHCGAADGPCWLG